MTAEWILIRFVPKWLPLLKIAKCVPTLNHSDPCMKPIWIFSEPEKSSGRAVPLPPALALLLALAKCYSLYVKILYVMARR